jgi:hypothetical protein
MKSKRYKISTVLAICVLTGICIAIVLADIGKPDSFQASNNGENITLHWVSGDESSVGHYEIERCLVVDRNFAYLATVNRKGAGLYEYVDNTAIMKPQTAYQYRLKIISNSADVKPVYVGPVAANYSVSVVARTWGSIKAMFR